MQAKRAELLFSYDARMSNPNGDPEENRPRIDRQTGKNLVTDFRLKRTIRDYLDKVEGEKIFMKQELVSPKSNVIKTIDDLAEPYITGSDKNRMINQDKLVGDHIDIRLFGLLFTVTGIHFKKIGAVQFAIGQSLNKVTEIPIRLVRVVPTREDVKSGGMGEKFVVRYSFIEFHGFVNDNVAKDIGLSEEDVKKMLGAMWKGTNSLSTSSKYGQQSRLLIKVNYKDQGYIGDLDLRCRMEDQEQVLENINQFKLNISELLNVLEANKNIIESVEYVGDNQLKCKNDKDGTLDEIIEEWSSKSKIKAVKIEL
ncbi:MAG: type I-B CRISPR-associated protein Cas7/Csh2 [Nitrosotalea sp.]